VLYDDADLCVYLHVCMCAHSVSQETSQLWLAITVTRLNGFLSLHCARPKLLCWGGDASSRSGVPVWGVTLEIFLKFLMEIEVDALLCHLK